MMVSLLDKGGESIIYINDIRKENNTMKKIISIVLAAVMLFAMSLTVMATDVPGSETQNVYINVNSGEAVYSVNITWGDTTFSYTSAGWSPVTLSYTGGWDKTEAKINVENRSDAPVNVAIALDNATKNGVTAALSTTGFQLGSAAEVGAVVAGKGPNQDVTVTITGAPTVTTNFELGKITVSLSKVTP